jgi:hypothetical protein
MNHKKKWVQENFKSTKFLLKPLNKEDAKDDRTYGVYNMKRELLSSCEFWNPKFDAGRCADSNHNRIFAFGGGEEVRFTVTQIGTAYIANQDLNLRLYNSVLSIPYISIGTCIRTD